MLSKEMKKHVYLHVDDEFDFNNNVAQSEGELNQSFPIYFRKCSIGGRKASTFSIKERKMYPNQMFGKECFR